jgi:hypothetical protein
MLFLKPTATATALLSVLVGCGGSTSGVASTHDTGSTGGESGASSGGASGGGSGGTGGSAGHGAGGSPSKGGSAGRGGVVGAGGIAGAGGMIGGGGAVSAGGSTGGTPAEDAGIPSVCPGSAPPLSGYATCRTVADCPSRTADACQLDPVGGCGPGPPPPQCQADSNCSGGQVCLQISPSGCSGLASHCIPPCTSTSCAADEVCAASGHCGPKPCNAGYACSSQTVCGPSKPNADAHGCAPASCASDGYTCPAGYRCAAGAKLDPHGCSDVSCTEGFVCPPNSDCNSASTALHHCEPRACVRDADCDCGACIGGLCRERLYVCSMYPV